MRLLGSCYRHRTHLNAVHSLTSQALSSEINKNRPRHSFFLVGVLGTGPVWRLKSPITRPACEYSLQNPA